MTISNPMDCSLPGSSIHGIFQARVLDWGAIAFSNICIHSPPNSVPIHTFLFLPPSLLLIKKCLPGEGNGNPLQYSCLEKSMDRGAWWAAVYEI